jgi:hypothetical protein
MINRVYFRETQRFNQWWIRVILAVPFLLLSWGFVQQVILGKPWGNNPGPDWLLWLLLPLVGIGVPALLLSIRLTTEIRDGEIAVQLFPFQWSPQEILASEIAEIGVRHYHPIREFGGWGLRYGPGGKALNIRGDMGIQLVLRTGKRLLIGTQRAREAAAALKAAGLG